MEKKKIWLKFYYFLHKSSLLTFLKPFLSIFLLAYPCVMLEIEVQKFLMQNITPCLCDLKCPESTENSGGRKQKQQTSGVSFLMCTEYAWTSKSGSTQRSMLCYQLCFGTVSTMQRPVIRKKGWMLTVNTVKTCSQWHFTSKNAKILHEILQYFSSYSTSCT